MPEVLLETKGLVKRYGGVIATDHVDFSVMTGEVHAIIGPNGAGKTTLLGQLSGELRPSAGDIFFKGERITNIPSFARSLSGIARSFQITCLCMGFTCRQNVELAVAARRRQMFSLWRNAESDSELADEAAHFLKEVGLDSKRDVMVGGLAHGEKRQLELAIAIATRPRLLLLDEPTAGLSRGESLEMAQLLTRLKSDYSIVLIEHDMDVVFNLADRISVLVYGRNIATGKPAEIRSNPRVRDAYLGEMI